MLGKKLKGLTEMTINCPACRKELPDEFGSYMESKIHGVHSSVDGLNAGVT
jgi:hypothetical protein